MGESAEAVAAQKRLAETVAAWIKARGLNPTEIQKATGLGRQTVYRVLDGKAGTTIDTLMRLASVFGGSVTAAGLLAGELPTTQRESASATVSRLPRELLEALDEIRSLAAENRLIALGAAATANEAKRLAERKGRGAA